MGLDAVGLRGRLSYLGFGYSILGVVIAFAIYPLIEAVVKFLNIPMVWWGNLIRLVSPLDIALVIIGGVVLVPILEEILYRGYIINVFRERIRSIFLVVLISAFIFGSLHLVIGPGMALYIFFWSFIPTYLYLKFKSLYPAIIMHTLNNLIAWVILPLLGI